MLGLCAILHGFTHVYHVALLPLYLLIQEDLALDSVEQATFLVSAMMIAKIIVHEATRARAIERMIDALKAVDIQGIKHNTPAVIEVLDSSAFRDGEVHTGIIQQLKSRQKAA